MARCNAATRPMNSSDLSPVMLLGFLALVAAFVLVAASLARAARKRKRAKRRIVEKPNSHYTSRLVQDTQTRHRWHDIALERVHEVNRAEVVRLLARVDATGVETLRPNERAFMDQIARIAPRPADPRPREQGVPLPHLRERPA